MKKAPLMAIVFSMVHGCEYVGGSSTAARCCSAAGVYCIMIRLGFLTCRAEVYLLLEQVFAALIPHDADAAVVVCRCWCCCVIALLAAVGGRVNVKWADGRGKAAEHWKLMNEIVKMLPIEAGRMTLRTYGFYFVFVMFMCLYGVCIVIRYYVLRVRFIGRFTC